MPKDFKKKCLNIIYKQMSGLNVYRIFSQSSALSYVGATTKGKRGIKQLISNNYKILQSWKVDKKEETKKPWFDLWDNGNVLEYEILSIANSVEELKELKQNYQAKYYGKHTDIVKENKPEIKTVNITDNGCEDTHIFIEEVKKNNQIENLKNELNEAKRLITDKQKIIDCLEEKMKEFLFHSFLNNKLSFE